MGKIIDKEFIVICDSRFRTVLEDAVDDINIISKFYCIADINTELKNIAIDLFERGAVRADVYIFILVGTWKKRKYVWNMLKTIGFLEEQLINIFQYYWGEANQMRYDRIMMHNNRTIDGLIFGISHGRMGIDENELPGNVINFSCSSQDIYFNFRTLYNVIKKYPEKLANVKYLIFDMFDYTYFNYDTLMAGECETFLEASGFECEFRNGIEKQRDVNKLNSELFEFWREGTKKDKKRELLELVFPKMKIKNNEWYKVWKDDLLDHTWTLSENDIMLYNITPSYSTIQLQVYEKTIQFQINAFEKFLNIVESVWPEAKVLGILLPKYDIVEKFEENVNEKWRPFFMKVIDFIEQKYEFFEFVDMKNTKNIDYVRKNTKYWWDMTHLNREGAIEITDHVNEILNNIIN